MMRRLSLSVAACIAALPSFAQNVGGSLAPNSGGGLSPVGLPSLTCPFTYCVDSVYGADASGGTGLYSKAYKTLTAVPTLTAGQSVGLAAGSYWQNQMLNLGTAANLTISSYGAGPRPIIDGAAAITNASLTADGSGGYFSGTITFAYNGVGQGSGPWINLLEVNGPGDPATGKIMTNVASQALVQTTACSYYIPGMSTAAGTPTSAVIYLHACDSSNPITSGYTYLYSNQRAAMYSSGGGYGTVVGVEGRNAAGKNGPFDFENNDGFGYTISSILARNCGDHCVVAPGGTTISNSVFINGYWGTQQSTFVVDYESASSGKPFVLSGNIYQQDQQPSNSGGAVAVISHSGNLAALGAITSSGEWFIAKNGANMIGPSPQYATTNLIGDIASQLSKFAYTSSNLFVTNSQSVSTYLYNNFVETSANGLSLVLSGNKVCSTNGVAIDKFNSNTALSVSLTNETYYRYDKTNSVDFVSNFASSAASALTVNGSVFDAAVQHTQPYDMGGSGWTFSGGASAGTTNSYSSADFVDNFTWNGAYFSSLPTWLSTISPQDTSAKTTGSGLSACTLPPMPSVN